MDKFNKTEQRVIAHLASLNGQPQTPTQIGMALGFVEMRASSRVASTLRALTLRKVLLRTEFERRRVEYSLVQ